MYLEDLSGILAGLLVIFLVFYFHQVKWGSDLIGYDGNLAKHKANK